jgi:hypothetical protein
VPRATTKPKSVISGELRPSQIITTFGPGAVVDQRTASVIIAGLDHWEVGDDQRIDEPRLRALLRVHSLYRPRVKTDRGLRGIPAFVFPTYLVCPRCDRLAHFRHFFFDGRRFRCRNKPGHLKVHVPKSGPIAFPARFVVACPAGHLDDFPWSTYVHRNETVACDELALTFFEGNQSGAVSDLFVRCETCERTRSMQDAFGEGAARILGACTGARPWIEPGDRESGCGEERRTVLRGASNLYFSIVQSALSIPEWDDPVHGAIAYYDGMKDVGSVDDVQKVHPFLERLKPFSPEHIWEALAARREVENSPPSAAEIRLEEFRALCAEQDPLEQIGREFQTEHVAVPDEFQKQIEHLVIVRRLREVRALDGFTRIDSPPDPRIEEDEHTQKVGLQSLAQHDPGWRPAVELLGEGIFVSLREQVVRKWETSSTVIDRVADMQRAHNEWRRERGLADAPYPGPRFVLLHSLSHMLITTLALDCGYSSTSLRERIFSGDDPNRPMAGILIYTATPDSDGSLGGLADQGATARFAHVLAIALRRSAYCSSDPLCGHARPGSMGHLNGAACHACLLVSETSCERSNQYLDRAHVVPTVGALGTEFFDA